MRLGFETLGNATLVFYENDRPVLATDPWLEGTCYFGSWALDRPLTEAERAAVEAAPFIWISHGHPDHLHPGSLAKLPKDKTILLPDHYHAEIRDSIAAMGFAVEVMPYRRWRQISPQVRAMCLDNENQDGILIVEAGDSLVVDLNDSPLCGEARFIKKLIGRYDRAKTYVASLCAIDADMINLIDAQGRRTIEPPEQRKKGMIWATARKIDRLGAGNFVSSASQHIYVRADSVWANPYRVTWADVEKHWTRPQVRKIEPFSIIDLESGAYHKKHPSQRSAVEQITDATAEDDWNERLSEAEWHALAAFFDKYETVRKYFDYIDVVVGGERRRVWLVAEAKGRAEARLRGIGFHVPRRSLLATVEYGYFDDILIGNFMKTELHNTTLYPHFTPLIAKLGGAAKVYTEAERRRFNRRYLRRNPLGYIEWHAGQKFDAFVDRVRWWSERFGVKRPLKSIYRRMIGDPVV
ncbi:MAG TPA: hypothetical protein VKV32_06035 [Stellaceae bacterium]|nr:hypothetical protein [Stellaceae bacterium]